MNFLTCPGVPELPATSSPAPAPEKKKRKRLWPWIVLGAIAVVLIVTVPPGIAAGRAAFAAQDAKTAITQAHAHAAAGDFVSTRADLQRARTDLGSIQTALRGIGFWRSFPGIGLQVRAIEDAAAAGAGTLDAASDLVTVFSTVSDAMRGHQAAVGSLQTGIAPTRRFEDLTKEEKRDVLTALSSSLSGMRLARDKIDLALELWNRVPQDQLIVPIRTALQPLADALPVFKRSLDEAVPLLEVALPLAGYPKPQDMLVLLQNADELRPAGGFIGTLGSVQTDVGDLSRFDFFDVYKIDELVSSTWSDVPPSQIADRLGVHAWFLRDSNWSPDFPTSADRVLDVFRREIEQATKAPLPNAPQTVVAIEPGFFAALLSITGPITVDGNTYDATNFFDKIEYDVEQGFLIEGIPVAQRKERLNQIGAAIVDRITSLPASRWPDLLHAFTTSLDRKQIQIYSHDTNLLAALDQRGWSGRAHASDQDFLWVVDANLAALKTDGVMNKTVAYNLDAHDPTNPTATVTLTYTNTNRVIDWRYTRYRSYTRVYVPEGSQLIGSSGAMKDDRYRTGGVVVPGTVDVFTELGKTVFGAFWSIEPGQTGALSFTYRLPPNALSEVASNTYRLDWPKQAGADATKLTLSLFFGKKVLSATPPEPSDKWGNARYEVQTDTLEDRTFTIQLEP